MRRIVNPENGATINLADLRLREGLFKPGESLDFNEVEAEFIRGRYGFLVEGVYEEKKVLPEQVEQPKVEQPVQAEKEKPKRKYTRRKLEDYS